MFIKESQRNGSIARCQRSTEPSWPRLVPQSRTRRPSGPHPSRRPDRLTRKGLAWPRSAAPVAAVGFVLVAGYQILLALGIAFSGAAWGGATLTSALRLASAISAVVLMVAALVVLGRAGYWGSRLPFAIFRWGTWILVVGMLLSALANFASPTVGERFFLGPSALLLALLCLATTRISDDSQDDSQAGGHS